MKEKEKKELDILNQTLNNLSRDSIYIMLGTSLSSRGLEAVNIFNTPSDNKLKSITLSDRESVKIFNKISRTPEFNMLFTIWENPYLEEFKIPDGITIDTFLNYNFEIKAIGTYWWRKREKVIRDMEDSHGIGEDALRRLKKLNEYNKELESLNNVHFEKEEIRSLVEVIVDHNFPSLESEKEKKVEMIIETSSRITLRAPEVAELDPYGVRLMPIKAVAIELLEGEEEKQEEDESVYGEFIPESTDLMLAQQLKSWNYKGVQITRLENGNSEVTFGEKTTQDYYDELLKHPDFVLLSRITSGLLYVEDLDFSKVQFPKFKQQRMQNRLKALFYDTQLKEYRRFTERFPDLTSNNIHLERDLAVQRRNALQNGNRTPFTVPDKVEIRSWVRKIGNTIHKNERKIN